MIAVFGINPSGLRTPTLFIPGLPGILTTLRTAIWRSASLGRISGWLLEQHHPERCLACKLDI
jgi:hypothetical protein